MLSNFLNYFRDEQDENPSFIKLTRNILIFAVAVNIVLAVLTLGLFGKESWNPIAFGALTINLIVTGVSLAFALQQQVTVAKWIVPISFIISIAVIAFTTNGLRDISMVGLPIVLIIAAVMLGKRSIWIMAPLALFIVLIVAFKDISSGRVVAKVGVDDVVIVLVLLVGCFAIVQVFVNQTLEYIEKLRQSEQAQTKEKSENREILQALRERVNQRTFDLDAAARLNARRARQLEAMSQVVRAISTIQDLDTILPYITQVISEHFNVYHTGIFLLDDNREYAVLRAANSDGGRKMLARGHKLPVGQTGIVGFVTATGQPRIALDIGDDAVFFDNPDLPDTHSEITMPLRYAGQMIGALDVQSVEANAFNQDDINVLTILADQVAAAIQNTLTLEEIRSALDEFQKSVGDNTRESWKVMRPKSLGLGFQLIGNEIKPLERLLEGEHIQDAIAQNKAILSDPENSSARMALPIRLRGQVVGIVNLRAQPGRQITSDDAEIVEAITERLSLAIETATLLQATRHRADVERVTTDISSKISASSRFETILQTAAQELSRALGGSDVIVQIEPASIESSMATEHG